MKDRSSQEFKLGGRKGVALIMVLTVIVILTVVSVEFQYESRVYMQTVSNFRDKVRARYLAKSALNFTRLIFHLQGTVDTMIKQFWKKNPPKIQLWQLIPVDSDLARAIAGGMFSMAEQESMFGDTVLGAGLEDEDSVASQQAEELNKSLNLSETTGFGEFEGHFHAEITDEERKINVNVRPNNYTEVNLMRAEMESLLGPAKFNPLFENPQEDDQYYDRQEIINSIIDWIDPDNTRQGFETGDESSRYDHLDDTYQSKNHMFDTLDEVQLVAGINDRFWRLFSDNLTIYRTNKININTANVEVIRALLEQYLEPPIPQEEEMKKIIDQIMDFRVQNAGFWNETAFVNFITRGPELFLELKNGSKGRKNLLKNITVESKIFTIKASGDINGVMTTAKVVMKKDGTLLYYREE